MWISSKDVQTSAQRIGCLVLSPKMKDTPVVKSPNQTNSVESEPSSPTSPNDLDTQEVIDSETVLFQRSSDNQKATCQIGKQRNLLEMPKMKRQVRLSLAEVLHHAETPFDTLDETLTSLNTYLTDDHLQGMLCSTEKRNVL
jgi:hypothetical protein